MNNFVYNYLVCFFNLFIIGFSDEQDLNISDPRVTIKADNRGIEGSELIIDDANFDDRAEYTCSATNEISSANVTILVRVKGKIYLIF